MMYFEIEKPKRNISKNCLHSSDGFGLHFARVLAGFRKLLATLRRFPPFLVLVSNSMHRVGLQGILEPSGLDFDCILRGLEGLLRNLVKVVMFFEFWGSVERKLCFQKHRKH